MRSPCRRSSLRMAISGTMGGMADVLDLRQFRSDQLDSLLRAEAAEWERELHWDYSSSLTLIRQYIDARILPGFVLATSRSPEARARGYGFFVYESRKGLIGDVFVQPVFREANYREEQRLLMHMIETLQATPGLARIESQLMTYEPGALSRQFVRTGFQAYRRYFMSFDLAHVPAVPVGYPTEDEGVTMLGEMRIEPWGRAGFDEGARLITAAYAEHLDGLINDQYRSFPGAIRFLHNIVHYPGCGIFDAASSFVARHQRTRQMIGLVLTSRVKDDVAHITQICTDPAVRQQGLGSALLGRTLQSLRTQGMQSVTLTVTQANATAVHLYRRLGFQFLREFDAWVWNR